MRYIFKNTQCLSKTYKVLIVLPKISNLNLMLKSWQLGYNKN